MKKLEQIFTSKFAGMLAVTFYTGFLVVAAYSFGLSAGTLPYQHLGVDLSRISAKLETLPPENLALVIEAAKDAKIGTKSRADIDSQVGAYTAQLKAFQEMEKLIWKEFNERNLAMTTLQTNVQWLSVFMILGAFLFRARPTNATATQPEQAKASVVPN